MTLVQLGKLLSDTFSVGSLGAGKDDDVAVTEHVICTVLHYISTVYCIYYCILYVLYTVCSNDYTVYTVYCICTIYYCILYIAMTELV